MYQRTDMELEELLEIESNEKRILLTQEYIKSFLKRYNKGNYEDTRNHWDEFIKIPEKIAAHSGTRVAIIIDEFQDMKYYVFDSTEERLDNLRIKAKDELYLAAIDLTATYDRQSLSKKAPMLVSGSAVTLIFRTVKGGPLGGRFDFEYLRPLVVDEAVELIKNLVKIYMPSETITTENAIYASAQVTEHPYYLYCIATSKCEKKSVSSKEEIDKIIDYEIKEGKIYGFWQTHFDQNKEYINNDNDKEIGKKIIYYFTKYNNKPVDIEEISKEIGITKDEVEKKIQKLYLADLVYKTKGKFYGFKDICLMRYIAYVYGRSYNPNVVWLCECKKRKTKMNLTDVKKLEKSKEAFLVEEEVSSARNKVAMPTVKLWYVSTGGFTKEALKYLKNKENVYYSDHEGINEVYKLYGGGFEVPVFDEKV